MKTLADFKRRITVGTILHAIHHQKAYRDESGKIQFSDDDMGDRSVSIVQSAQFALKTQKSDGTICDSWVNFPKATECKLSDNSITIYGPDWRPDAGHIRGNEPMIPLLTYRFV